MYPKVLMSRSIIGSRGSKHDAVLFSSLVSWFDRPLYWYHCGAYFLPMMATGSSRLITSTGKKTKSQNNHPHKHTNCRSSSSLAVPKLVLGLSLFLIPEPDIVVVMGWNILRHPWYEFVHIWRERRWVINPTQTTSTENREGVFPKGTTGVATRRENRCYVPPKSVCYREKIKSSLGFCFVF